jgi:NADH:ubiquinone oxidoreductase subunit F (NADH-binding)
MTAVERRVISVRRLLPDTVGTPGLSEHTRDWGPLPSCTAQELLADVEASCLLGRGGAAFPTARKMRAVVAAGGRSVVVANGAEGEPASAKDEVLLHNAPHLVLDGIQLAARAVGANTAHLVVHGGGGHAERLRASIRERGDRVPVDVHELPSAYVASEATAVVHWLNTGDARPTSTPRRMSEVGVRGHPTLVNNVETLAHVAAIARGGPEWFRAVGDPEQPGTLLITLTAAGVDRHVVETETGTVVGDLLADAGVTPDNTAALLIGGYLGTWFSSARGMRLRLSSPALRTVGGALGAGIVVAFPEERCGILEAARVAGYLEAHSAGQCGPCRNGLSGIAGVLRRLAIGPWDDRDWPALQRWLSAVAGRGACQLPDGAAAFVRSALVTFEGDLVTHRRGRPCAATSSGPFLPLPPSASTPTWR